MNLARRASWEERHRGAIPGEPEASLLEMLPLMKPGLALDVASGTGRNAIALARAGWRVIAVDFSNVAVRILNDLARQAALPISAVLADLEEPLPFGAGAYDLVVNISYLDRALIPRLKAVLRPGGALLFDTFLVDEATNGGHPSNPLFTLDHYELRALLAGLELMRYREGLVNYPNGKRAWRAAALARRSD